MKLHWAKIGLLSSFLLVCLAMLFYTLPVLAAVTLVRFEMTSITSSVITLEWETASEYNNLGFFIRRSSSEGGSYSQISEFISAEGSAVNGSIYQFSDDGIVPGQIYYYKLEAIDLNSNSEFFGPISNAPNPTATSTTTVANVTATQTTTGTLSATNSTPQTQTATARASSTLTVTPSPSETSPFSFVTNTSTLTPSQTTTTTITPAAESVGTPTETSIATKIEVKTATSAISPQPSPSIVVTVDTVRPAIRSVSIGFGIVMTGGLLGIAVLILFSKMKRGKNG